MAIQEIRLFGDPVLRTPATEVVDFDVELRKLVKDLEDTMMDAPGAGLAAPQIGVGLRVFTYYVDDVLGHLVNPVLELSTECQDGEEGCLSIPGYVAYVSRKEKVWVVAQNRVGKKIKVAGSGLLGRALQHELDHLDGKLYIDYLDSMDDLIPVSQLEEEDEDAQERLRTLA